MIQSNGVCELTRSYVDIAGHVARKSDDNSCWISSAKIIKIIRNSRGVCCVNRCVYSANMLSLTRTYICKSPGVPGTIPTLCYPYIRIFRLIFRCPPGKRDELRSIDHSAAGRVSTVNLTGLRVANERGSPK